MKKFYIIIGLFVLTGCKKNVDRFEVIEKPAGYLVTESQKNVLFYQTAPKALNGEYKRSNYIHPLYGIDNDTLTEDFPDDHPHHRGIFWTWHQQWIGDQRIGDAWVTEDIEWKFEQFSSSFLDQDILNINASFVWLSPNYVNQSDKQVPFVKDSSSIFIHPLDNNTRVLDFEIFIIPLVDSFYLGGSEDAKGYGGFSARIKLPEDIRFHSDSSEIEPIRLALEAGNSMIFKGTFNKKKATNSIKIVASSDNPEPNNKWILRKTRSMQNAVWPGREKVHLSKYDTLRLKYSVEISKK